MSDRPPPNIPDEPCPHCNGTGIKPRNLIWGTEMRQISVEDRAFKNNSDWSMGAYWITTPDPESIHDDDVWVIGTGGTLSSWVRLVDGSDHNE